jgi:hypothetical protein
MQITNNGVYKPKDLSINTQLQCDEVVMEEDNRWMDEDYRVAWQAEGIQTTNKRR